MVSLPVILSVTWENPSTLYVTLLDFASNTNVKADTVMRVSLLEQGRAPSVSSFDAWAGTMYKINRHRMQN